MTNPIPRNEFCFTPDTFEALEKYFAMLPGHERSIAMLAASVALNLAHKLVEEQAQAA